MVDRIRRWNTRITSRYVDNTDDLRKAENQLDMVEAGPRVNTRITRTRTRTSMLHQRINAVPRALADR